MLYYKMSCIIACDKCNTLRFMSPIVYRIRGDECTAYVLHCIVCYMRNDHFNKNKTPQPMLNRRATQKRHCKG